MGNKIFKLILFTIILGLLACSKESFSPTENTESYSTADALINSQSSCAQHTLVKPEVDLLILWDNSGSSLLIDANTKSSIVSAIGNISEDFSYRMLMAPLIKPASDELKYYTNDNDDLSGGYSISNIASLTAFSTVSGGSIEKGFERSYDLLNSHKSTFFRSGAYHIVVIISNEDDDYYDEDDDTSYWVNARAQVDYNNWKSSFDSLKSSLNTSMFRFISIQPHSSSGDCTNPPHHRYRDMSNEFYGQTSEDYSGGATDQNGRTYPDSYDLCTTEHAQLFDGLYSSIQSTVQSHVYEYWLVDETTSPTVSWDTDSLAVSDLYGSTIPESDTNGFKYVGYKYNQYTRAGYYVDSSFTEDEGEEMTGHFIQLVGNYAPTASSRIQYPNCLFITTSNPIDTYGYVYISEEPDASTIELTINGAAVSQSNSNGWQYIGYQTNLNMKVSGSPGMYRTGYFLQLFGNAQYSNGASVSVRYIRASN
ncbi:MAG: hypothetical protein HOE90_08715 [Bacteriovoracaceae bacterium]|jgi:hypothetical protein|nr:hypothetical protein [Bacteriovoracaceae bacterium]